MPVQTRSRNQNSVLPDTSYSVRNFCFETDGNTLSVLSPEGLPLATWDLRFRRQTSGCITLPLPDADTLTDTDALNEYSTRHWLAWKRKERVWHRRIARPEAENVILITAKADENLFFTFRSDEVEIIRDQEDLIFSFPDGALLVLSGFLDRSLPDQPSGFRFLDTDPAQTAPMA